MSHPERRTERERKKRKERMTRGDQASVSEAHNFILELLYLDLYIEGNERYKVIQSQPKHYICFVFIETRIFLHTFPINNVVYIIFWPWRPVDIL